LRNLTPGANTVRLFGDNLTNTTPSRVPSPSPPPASQALSPPPATPVSLSHSSGVLATGSRCGPKPSLLSENMMQAARDSIKLVPKKRSFEEGILELQKENIRSIEKRDSNQLKLKKRKLLLEELKLGVWTKSPERSVSPAWDIENGDGLPDNDDDL